MAECVELDKEVRHMQASHMLQLCSFLNRNDSWKKLMSLVKNDDESESLKYSMTHISLIENARDNNRTCSEIFLDEWGTSGKVRPRFSTLLKYLIEAQLYGAAEYVHKELLEGEEPLERPSTGPAASINLADLINFPSSTIGSENVNHDVDITNDSSHVEVSEPENVNSLENTNTLENVNTFENVNSLETDERNHPIMSATLPVSNLNDYPKKIRYSDLENWSDGFSKRLGHGAFGSVYLCYIPDMQSQVAVKRLQMNNSVAPLDQLSHQFQNEISTLSLFKNDNVLSLLGYSTDGPDLCLVYNYMPQGSLEDKIKEGCKDLEWDIRLDISQGTARGIHYLHTFSTKPFIHRDIKSANILLDDQLKPKIGDFGLARPAPMETIATTTIVGTTAYMSPEALRGDISIKMDVFSFGVVLLELVTGLLAWDENRESLSLISFVEDVNDIDLLIDSRPDNNQEHIALKIFDVSSKCIEEKKHLRPNMEEALDMLLKIPLHSS